MPPPDRGAGRVLARRQRRPKSSDCSGSQAAGHTPTAASCQPTSDGSTIAPALLTTSQRGACHPPSSCVASAATTGAIASPAHSPPTSLSATISRAATPPTGTPAASTPAAAVVTPPAAAAGEWRCHPMFQSSQQLPHAHCHQLHLGSSRRLLRSKQPLLLPAAHLVNIVNPLTRPPADLPTSHVLFEQQAQPLSGQPLPVAGDSGLAPAAVQLLPLADAKQKAPTVLTSPADSHVFIECDASKNLLGGYYHVRKPETNQLYLGTAEALRCSSSWTKTNVFVKGLLAEWQLKLKPTSAGASAVRGSSEAATGVPPAPQLVLSVDPANWKAVAQAVAASQQQLPPAGEATADPVSSAATAGLDAAASLLHHDLLAQLVNTGGWVPAGQLTFDFGQQHALLPARYQLQDQVVCQVTGSRRVLLVSPGDGLVGLYPYPVSHPYDTYSCVDLEQPELEHWQRAAQVQGYVVDLHPGDALVVPAYWWVHGELLQPNSCSCTLQLQPGPQQVPTKGALLLQLSRCIEAWTAAVVGLPNTRSWLMALAQRTEWGSMQLQTTKGVSRVQLAALIMQQLQQVLAMADTDAAAAQLTALLAEERKGGHDQQQRLETSVAASSTAVGPEQWQLIARHLTDGAGGPQQQVLEGLARHFLRLLCDERLIPTTWLNENIRDPLYLQHPPQHYLLLEDAEAARYPQLFRHRLKGGSADWMNHASKLTLTDSRPAPLQLADGQQAAQQL